jgi:hypothetical protein
MTCPDAELNNVEADQDLTADDLLPWLRKVDKLVRLAAGFRDSFSEESLRQQLDSMSEMYKVITGEVAPHLMEGERDERLRMHVVGRSLTRLHDQGSALI